jgi:tetratricopeptide (TPR) repeat protein
MAWGNATIGLPHADPIRRQALVKRKLYIGIVLLLMIVFIGCSNYGRTEYEDAILDGVAHLNTQKPEKALQDFNRAISIDSNIVDGYIGRGNSLNTLGRHEEAIKDYNMALTFDDTVANVYVNRAVAYSHLEEYEKAIADFEKGLELDPKIDNAPGFFKKLFENVSTEEKGIRKYLEHLKNQMKANKESSQITPKQNT